MIVSRADEHSHALIYKYSAALLISFLTLQTRTSYRTPAYSYGIIEQIFQGPTVMFR